MSWGGHSKRKTTKSQKNQTGRILRGDCQLTGVASCRIGERKNGEIDFFICDYMRLIFLYVSDRKAPAYVEMFKTEGYWWLLKRLLETSIVDEVLVVMTSKRSQEFSYGKNFHGVIVTGLQDLDSVLRPNDVIWCRGGWKAWADHLRRWADEGRWLICYAANTGRQKWPFWSVVFDDLSGRTCVDGRGRFQLDWKKPTNPEIFKLMDRERVFDVCIGASHIHDKKAQWKTVKVIAEHQKIFGRKLRCVMPGRQVHGVHTNNLMSDISKYRLRVAMLGMVPRLEVAKIMNRSKLFVRFGGGGQNDRGPLEALRCGCMLLLETPSRHAPFLSKLSQMIAEDPNNLQSLAKQIEILLQFSSKEVHKSMFEMHEQKSGVENVIIPAMSKLFGVMREYPKKSIEKLREVYGV